jgi:hypothetical protein
VRHRAKPFAVEVKRSNKRVPFTAAAAASFPSERHWQADRLLFAGPSSRVEPTGPAGLARVGDLSTDKAVVKPQAPAVEAGMPEIDVKAGRVRPTGRILPDLLEQSRAEARLRQELEEREVQVPSPRGARPPSSGPRPKRAKVQTSAEGHAERKAILEPTPTAEIVNVKEPVLALVGDTAPAAVKPVIASSPCPPGRSRQRAGTARVNTTRGANQALGQRAERREPSVLLRAGEKWKRRLPRVCW